MPLIEKETAQDSDDEAKLVQEQSNDEKTQGGAWFLHPRCSNYMTSHNLIKFDSMSLQAKGTNNMVYLLYINKYISVQFDFSNVYMNIY
jgi:hypothetical protein